VGWQAGRAAGRLDRGGAEARHHPSPTTGRRWCAHPAIDVVVECTGHPIAAVDHCLEAFAHGKHVVNVTVEADAFCGPLLARKARGRPAWSIRWPSATSRR
jgi:threonine dehydrogenase-like Zn-dependent dehydrogenase